MRCRHTAVFAGGGVKGAALAGGLAAAQSQGVEFVGYGGTSAGSIVAALAAAGYTGQELGDILIAKDFREFLDDGGSRLKKLVAAARRAVSTPSILWRLTAPQSRGAVSLWWFSKTLASTLGLYRGDKLTRFLDERIREKIRAIGTPESLQIAAKETITFEDLETLRQPLLRVVALERVTTNARRVAARRRRIWRFDCHRRAGVGWLPDRVSPRCIADNHLVDGGLASNLPVFLFAEEAQNSRLPTFAFDLESEADNLAPGAQTGLFRFIGQMANTGLEASDILLRDVAENLLHLRIKIPSDVGTLDFDISRQRRSQLFETGFTQTIQQLSEYEPINFVHTPGIELHARLIAQYGEPEVYLSVLRALIHDIESRSRATNLRAHVMLLTGQRLASGDGTRMVVYQVGMNGDADQDLMLADSAGCSGFAWRSRSPMLADLEQAAQNPAAWGMTPEQQARIPTDRRSMISVPIPAPRRSLGNNGPTIHRQSGHSQLTRRLGWPILYG